MYSDGFFQVIGFVTVFLFNTCHGALTFLHYVFQRAEFYLSKVEQQPCISTMMALLPHIENIQIYDIKTHTNIYLLVSKRPNLTFGYNL